MAKKEKYQLEFDLKSSPRVLYNRLSTPGGLSEWFADDVNLRGKIFTFIWDGSEEKANLIAKKDQLFVRFRWEDEEDEEAYFEFRIDVHELTGDVALIITDFANPDEKDDAIGLWESQVADLKRLLGT